MKNPRPRPEYEALITKILAGEISRKEAATISKEQTGLSEQSFFSWITKSKDIREKLRPTNGNRGQNSVHAHKDPDKVKAYEDAISEVLAGRPANVAAKKYGVNYTYLCRRARTIAKEQRALNPTASPADDRTVAALEAALRPAAQ